MRRRAGRWRAAGLLLVFALATFAALLVTRSAQADPRTEYLVKQLKSDDFRVRTQAALALGASRDPAAVPPLCGALADSNTSVRIVAAAALGKLGFDKGAGCLKQAKGKEKDASVVAAIDKAVEKIALGGDPPPPAAGAKYYVAIQVTNKTKRPNIEIEGVVRKAIQEKLLKAGDSAVAPRSETVQQAKDVATAKKLTGYLLIASVEPFSYAGGNLTVQLKVTMWTYPDKALKAEFSPKLTMEGAASEDRAGENELTKMASDMVVSSFRKVAASL